MLDVDDELEKDVVQRRQQKQNQLEGSSTVVYNIGTTPKVKKEEEKNVEAVGYSPSTIMSFQSVPPESNMTTSDVWNAVIQRCEKKQNSPSAIQIAVLGNHDVGKTSL